MYANNKKKKMLHQDESSPVELVNPLLHLFNPPAAVAAPQEKRKPGRPRKEQPILPHGHYKHTMSDDSKLAESKAADFPLIEQRRFQNEYQYELNVMKRSPKAIITELAELYGIDYAVAHDCIKDLPL